MCLGCQSLIYIFDILNQIDVNWDINYWRIMLYYFFPIFIKSFALFTQIKFCKGRKFPSISMLAKSCMAQIKYIIIE